MALVTYLNTNLGTCTTRGKGVATGTGDLTVLVFWVDIGLHIDVLSRFSAGLEWHMIFGVVAESSRLATSPRGLQASGR